MVPRSETAREVRDMEDERFDAIVVGAGPAGIAAAKTMAAAGLSAPRMAVETPRRAAPTAGVSGRGGCAARPTAWWGAIATA